MDGISLLAAHVALCTASSLKSTWPLDPDPGVITKHWLYSCCSIAHSFTYSSWTMKTFARFCIHVTSTWYMQLAAKTERCLHWNRSSLPVLPHVSPWIDPVPCNSDFALCDAGQRRGWTLTDPLVQGPNSCGLQLKLEVWSTWMWPLLPKGSVTSDVPYE